MSEMIVNFFTASDFVGLLTRRAMLPLIVFSLLFGFAVNLNGGKDTMVGKFLEDLTNVMLKFVKIVTYYAPIAFFAIFADLVATYGSQVTVTYGRALLLYYPLCFVYIFTAWPLFARFGGGKGAVKVMFQHITRPAVVSLGTCSSVATIPTNMEVAQEPGISKDVSDMVLPLGATMHMDGSCFSCVLKIAFVWGVFGQDMGFNQLIPVVLVAVLSSVGMSGVPGGGYIGEYIICSIFFPEQMEVAFPILVAIGNLVDQLRRRLCGLLYRLPLRGRQGLAAEGTGRQELISFEKNPLFSRTADFFPCYAFLLSSCSLTLLPKGVVASPPRAVSRNSTGIRRPTSPIQSMT